MPHPYTSGQIEILSARAIDEDTAHRYDIVSVRTPEDLPPGCPDYWSVEGGYLPGLLFAYSSPSGDRVLQLRPDTPPLDSDGDPKKYVFAPGSKSVLNQLVPVGPGTIGVLIVEGTCQAIAAAAVAPDGWAVYGIAGCQSWQSRGVPSGDLAIVDGLDVLIALDADAATNRSVYDAGVALREACLAEGASRVEFVRVPGGRKTGLDDALAGQPDERRRTWLGRQVELSRSRPRKDKPEQPAATKPAALKVRPPVAPDDPARFFDTGNGGGLLTATLSDEVRATWPSMLTREQRVAVYRDGAYRIDGTAFLSAVTDLLGETFRRAHLDNAEAYTVGQLHGAGTYLPERLDTPMLNVKNGMLDLRTGELVPHSPDWLSSYQITVPWQPSATCPLYEEWLAQCAGADQIDILEEAIAPVLDPSRTPGKAVFLFGPSRSGKGTFQRLVQSVVGAEYTSGVSLHQLASNRFMAAQLFGKILNIGADLSSANVDDLSVFKMLTGEDTIEADRKFGKAFSFTNRALFLFGANVLPTVSEDSLAYAARIVPVRFGRSFLGSEDPGVEAGLAAELPGILVRWVRAWQRRTERGWPLPPLAQVKDQFEMDSDRVRKFLYEWCEVVEVDGTVSSAPGLLTRSDLTRAFREWAEESGGHPLPLGKITKRLETVAGVRVVRDGKKAQVYNIRLVPKDHRGQRVSGMSVSTPLLGGEGGDSRLLAPSGNFLSIFPSQQTRDDLDSLGVDHEKTHKKLPLEASRPESPPSPPSNGIEHPEPDSSAILSLLSTAAGGDTAARCDRCDAEMVLVDRTWWACPSCHPDTARIDGSIEGGR